MIEILVGLVVAFIIFLYIIGTNVTPIILVLLIMGGLYFLMQAQGNLQIGNIGKGIKKDISISFDDIGGQETAAGELKEALQFLMKPEEITRMGIRPLKGVLLVGPPGTGKTLLARAAASYTKSVFITVSGSEFIEMYAGVGAKRVRNLFKDARKKAKNSDCNNAIIFIDELEVLGGKRGSNTSHMEYDQTLNQLLVEMDGISKHEDLPILIIGATNRADMLDSALLRPGRFDRQVQVGLPDKCGRSKILDIHTRNKPVENKTDLEEIARATFGFSGAHLESLSNEAAILAMREGNEQIYKEHFMEAIDKVIMGEKLERKPIRSELERVSIHETGHAIVSEVVEPGSVASLTIIPRGKALGFMRKSPQDDQYLYTREHLENQIMIMLAGAIAEEIKYGNRSTGAQNDFVQAWDLTRKIIDAGLSSLGIVNSSDVPTEILYKECKEILRKMEIKTQEVLEKRQTVLFNIADYILEEETIDREKLIELLN
ncbi:MAG TPA: AAA family ATPase [Syntrophomonadaceae bacterium]|nr:AAA family ATPase [Syntrophomonadaceae bacterium]